MRDEGQTGARWFHRADRLAQVHVDLTCAIRIVLRIMKLAMSLDYVCLA